ncbi:SDR family oxidoreductase [Lysinibacillus mangiferihumi]|uniref:SDR family oxidoreductase n=1 Tax=Lysinibacillus mangiferihumi TaxID=1130819 RepID=A0A4U2YID8_9BACI|nr:SDR family NAD(P)-dependent oxidoreductase [Lysinibacillus mangiferihumi]TKI60062.1 SDR family oxidoreductase [Lysinibacillus mangiferihumi]
MKKTVVILGGAGFIGRSIAKCFGKDGYSISLLDKDEEALNSATTFLRDLGIECYPKKVDALNEKQLKQEANNLFEEFGSIAVLVSAIGYSPKLNGKRPNTLDIQGEEWRLVMDINLNAVYYGISAFLPKMLASKGGRIVIISSVAGLAGSLTAGIHYCAAKSALVGLTKSLATEFASEGILVNSVAPGKIENSDWGDDSYEIEKYTSTVPLGRLAKVEEVSEVIKFLGSEKNTYITGKVVTIDGGRTPI